MHITGFQRLRLVSASARTGLGRGPLREASRDGPRLPYDVTVYGISIERPICYLRIALDRYLIYNKELFCSVLFYKNPNMLKFNQLMNTSNKQELLHRIFIVVDV